MSVFSQNNQNFGVGCGCDVKFYSPLFTSVIHVAASIPRCIHINRHSVSKTLKQHNYQVSALTVNKTEDYVNSILVG